jgi:hypothetical protein
MSSDILIYNISKNRRTSARHHHRGSISMDKEHADKHEKKNEKCKAKEAPGVC